MKKQAIKSVSAVLASILLLTPAAVFADSRNPYVAFGADLTPSNKQVVKNLLNITDADLANDTVITVTNQDEHQYLDGQISQSLIGTKALSSCKVEDATDGSGINVTTKNITYCTAAMYENALATAGMEDANVTVAAPYNISGTAALVGAMKAYSAMNGTTVDSAQVSAASNELATTGEIAQSTGDPEKTAELMAAVKSQVADQNMTDEQIGDVVDKTADQLGIELTDSDKQKIVSLMTQLSALDLNANNLAQQARNVYQNAVKDGLDLSKYGISGSALQSFVSKTPDFLKNFITWLKGLFNR